MRHLRSPGQRKKRQKRLIIKTLLYISCLTLIIGIPVLLFRISGIQIKEFTVEGAVAVSSEEIVAAVKKESSGNYLFLFPKSNVILFPQKKIEKKIIKDFPRIESVDVNLTSFQGATITITERKPLAVWCDSNLPEKCFLVDINGLVFDNAPQVSSNLFFVYRGFLTDEPIGKTYLSPGLIQKLRTFVAGVKLLGPEPTSLAALSDSQFELSIKGGGKILFAWEENGDQILSNLGSVLQDRNLSVIEGGVLLVDAIDMRYGNKIILKKKGE